MRRVKRRRAERCQFSASARCQASNRREDLWADYDKGTLRPRIDALIPLTEAARAHEIIEARANLGKVVLVP